MLPDFYGTFAQICFTVLGLWWVVVQFKYEQWMTRRATRRLAYQISLYFLLPGTMSLASLVNAEDGTFWQLGFTVGGLVGLAASISYLRDLSSPRLEVLLAIGSSIVVYSAAALIALFPGLIRDLDAGVRPIEVEALLAVYMLLTGVQLAWMLFSDDRQTASS